MEKRKNYVDVKNESYGLPKTILLDSCTLDTLFNKFYKEIKERSRMVYYKMRQLELSDNFYTSDDILHDFYFEIKRRVEKEDILFNSESHFMAICYLRMKEGYYIYLRNKRNKAKIEKKYFTELGYTHKADDIIRNIFNNEEVGVLKEHVTEQDILNVINDFDNEEQKRILNLKTKHVTNEKLGNYLKYTNDELRSKIYYSRKKLFKKMGEKQYLNDKITYNDIIGRDNNGKTATFNTLENNKKNYYNDYPFELSFKKKIMFILSKNKKGIDINKLKLILKINEGKSLQQDSRNHVNKSISENIADKKCFLMDGILYSNG